MAVGERMMMMGHLGGRKERKVVVNLALKPTRYSGRGSGDNTACRIT